jgi:GT2 family glycosyltransferase
MERSVRSRTAGFRHVGITTLTADRSPLLNAAGVFIVLRGYYSFTALKPEGRPVWGRENRVIRSTESVMVDVTVSIVHASRTELTLGCLESLEGDATRCSTEIVVLDNASGENLAAAVSKRFPNVRVIEQSFRAGFAANQNTVISQTAGRYILVLNPDTHVPPSTVDTLVDYMDRHPEAAVAGPAIRGFDGVQQASAWRPMTITARLVWALTLGQFGLVVRRRTARHVHAVSACSMLARRSALEQVGLFDESFFMFSEEWDLAERLDRLKLERHYVPEVEVIHHGQESTKHVLERQVNETWRSFDLYLARYRSPQEARVLRAIAGLGYALVLVTGAGLQALPRCLRPSRARSWTPVAYKLHVRNAFRGTREPGLKELAEEWNRVHATSPSDEHGSGKGRHRRATA